MLLFYKKNRCPLKNRISQHFMGHAFIIAGHSGDFELHHSCLRRVVCRLRAFLRPEMRGRPFLEPDLGSFVPARIVWTRVCNSGGLFHGGCLTGFMG
jgi:hypothetical protein